MSRNCEICGSNHKIKLFTQDFQNTILPPMEKYDVVRCTACGFIFGDNLPSQEDFDHYYSNSSRWEFTHTAGQVTPTHNKFNLKLAELLKPHIPHSGAKILEVGCATGDLLGILKDAGYKNLLGVDPSKQCVRSVIEKRGISAIVNTIELKHTHFAEKFDIVILSAVLEHVVNLQSAVKRLWEELQFGGIVFVEVPDAERFVNHISTPFQQFSTEHINYFTQTSLSQLFESNGFEAVAKHFDTNTVNLTIDPNLIYVFRKKERAPYRLTLDLFGEYKINQYIRECTYKEQELTKIIQSKLSSVEKVIVWGVGTSTQRILGRILPLEKIAYLVDSINHYHGKEVLGLLIKLPEEITDNFPILIATYSYRDEIKGIIRSKLCLTNEVIELYD